MKNEVNRAILISIAVVLVQSLAWTQESRGSITGLVLDSSGAPVPKVQIIATNIATNVSSSTTTNTTGNYSIPYLIPGNYEVSAESSGFGKVLRKDIVVRVGDRLGIDFTLSPATIQTSVQVLETTPVLQTETANVGTIFDRRKISDLPLADGNAFMLSNLSAGVVFTDEVMNSTRPFDTGSVSGIRTQGAPGGNTFTIDGAPNTSSSRGGSQNGAAVAFVPPADAVQEFKVETASFDAQHGHSPGASINVSLKSGTNQLHGSAYEFYRPASLLAQEFYAKRAGRPASDFTYQRFGGTLGGPIVIPKLYNGRNKTFFFASYENLLNQRPASSLYTVPTLKERTGDFSALSTTIYDPATGVKEGSRIRRLPFAGNLIPTARLDQIAVNYLKYYPEPNLPGLATGENNLSANQSTDDTYNSQLGRIDHVFNDRNRSFLQGYRSHRSQTIGTPGWAGTQNGINPSSTVLIRENLSANADHVFIISPSKILDIKGGIARWSDGTGPVAPGFDLSTLGFPGSTLGQFRGQSYFPAFNITGFQSMGASPGKFTGDTNLFLSPTFTNIRGRHTLRIGYDIRAYRENGSAAQSPSGTYTFGSTYTQGPLDNSAAQFGQSLGSLLVGLPTGGSVDRAASYAAQTLYQAVFLHDDFRVNSRLTLNLGLRYEVETPTTERHNRNIRGFDTTTPSPIETAVRAAYAAKPDPTGIAAADLRVPGGLLFADSNNRSFWPTDRNNVQPRAGFAFQVAPKTVLRGGWGMYMVPWIVTGIQQSGFSQSTSVTTTVDSGLTFIGSIANPFPRGINEPAGSSAGLGTFIGQAIAAFAPLTRKNGMAQRWEIALQRELPRKWLLEVSYAGTRGYDLAVPLDINTIHARYLSTTGTRNQSVIDYLGALVANPFQNIAPSTTTLGSSATIARSTLLRPFPEFSSVTTERSDGSSIYHGLQSRLERRFQGGYTVAIGYTFSKLRERTTILNATDVNPEDRVAADDRPNRFTISGIYELPFGRERHWGRQWNRGVDLAFGGWQFGWLYMVQTGRPLALPNVYYNGDLDSLSTAFDKRTIDSPVFNISGFYFQDSAVMTGGVVDPSKQRKDSRISLANNIRALPSLLSSFRGPMTMNLDASLIKTVSISERIKVQLRGEALNTTNYIQFGEPSLTPTSATFGIVSRTRNPTRQIQFAARLTF